MTCYVADLYHGNPVDFAKLRAARYDGIACEAIFHKATQGAGVADPQYAQRYGQAVAQGFLWGAYHFNTGEPIKDQVSWFFGIAAPDASMAMALDFEDNTHSEMSLAECLEFLDRGDQILGRRLALYSGNRLKSVIPAATDAQRDFLAEHLPWVPEYGPVCKMVDVKSRPLPWAAPTLWQFTGDGIGNKPHSLDGLQQGADLSLFHGTRLDLEEAWVGNLIASPPVVVANNAPAPVPSLDTPRVAPPPASGFRLWFDHLRNEA